MKPKYSDDDASMLYIVPSEVQTQENSFSLKRKVKNLEKYLKFRLKVFFMWTVVAHRKRFKADV